MSSPAPVLKEEQHIESVVNTPVVSQEETRNSSPATTPSNQANVEKMLQVFQQFASNQQGNQQANGIQQQILQQQVMQQLQLQQAVAAVQTLQKQLQDQFEPARNLVRDLQQSPKQNNSPPSRQSESHHHRGQSQPCRSMLPFGQNSNNMSPQSGGNGGRSGGGQSGDLMNNPNPAGSLLRPQHGLPPLAARGRPHFHPGQMDDSIQLEELERFAKDFKQKRIKLGFTQGDVGVAMGRLYGSDFSQTTISRFEALNLSFKNMCKLKPILERWLDDAERYLNPNSNSMTEQQLESARRRKKRTSIDSTIKVALEMSFLRNSRPTSAEISKLAEELEMERETVRVWFCNRRQKEKRIGSNGDEESGSNPDSPASDAALPLPSGSPLPITFPPGVTNTNGNSHPTPPAWPSTPAAGNLDFYKHFASNLNHKNLVMAAAVANGAAASAEMNQISPFGFFPNMSLPSSMVSMPPPINSPAEITEISTGTNAKVLTS